MTFSELVAFCLGETENVTFSYSGAYGSDEPLPLFIVYIVNFTSGSASFLLFSSVLMHRSSLFMR